MDMTEDHKIRKRNGEIVMDALKCLQEPATLTNVVRYVAETQQLSPSTIKEPIKEVLMKGVEYGFLQKSGAKYSVDAPQDASASDVDEELDADDADDDEVEDRSRRRGRKGRRRSRKRGRTRSRSRRKRRQ